ncbi:uncharacterized protein [Macrobrachium rosenbergii]|uniref:uncharacterized protein isoform X2 n=1 Tax=Macrobrachium rosenbergii TaxID=79674 RepID=UPI0034D45EFB
MDTLSGVTSHIPWSWLWRRGVVLLLVGVVVFSLFFSDSPPPKDPPPLALSKDASEIDVSSSPQESKNDLEQATFNPAVYPTPFICSEPSCPPCPVDTLSSPDDASDDGSFKTKQKEAPMTTDDPLFSVEYRRRLADAIANVQRQISRVAGRQAMVDGKWALTLGAIVDELDPRRFLSLNSSRDLEGNKTASSTNRTRHVCPEVFMGKRYDHPFYQHGMETSNCSDVPDFSQTLTAILPAQSWSPSDANFIISKLSKQYDIPIIALVSNRTTLKFKQKNIKILVARKNYSEATLLNGLMKLSRTPYVFLGPSLTHFTNQSSLERLVRILDETEHVKVVGGAARDAHGHWIHGCLQQKMSNYRAKYTIGYYYSKSECMYCDDLLTPFVTTKKLVAEIPFTEGLHGPALLRDWFAKVREAGHLTMTCPDVMFFVNNHASMTGGDWQMMAQQWALQEIHSYTDDVYSFTCDSVNIKCDNLRSITKSLLLPPCCIEDAHKDVGFLIDFADSRGLEYELQAGSVLGAVKFGSFLPWDMDHDIFVECKDFKTWTKEFSIFSKTFNCTPKVKYKNTFLKIFCRSFTLDIFCRSRMSKIFLPEEYQDIPTTIWYGGRWTKVVSNPGLFSRNSIGSEILKHMQHSTHFTDTETSRGYGRAGVWLPCKVPKHHSCLDRYPADGSLPFLR